MAFDGFQERVEAYGAARSTTHGAALEAAVVAHDLNNVLGVILAANEALLARLPAGSDARELASLSDDAALKGAALLRRFLDASAGRKAGSELGKLLTVVARLSAITGPEGVRFETFAPDPTVRCLADDDSLDQALMNLCANSLHALPTGGRIVLTAEACDLDAAGSATLDVAPGAYVKVSVADDGVGMPPHVLKRATEAYFTTRAGRGGTGLGLSGVASFARDAGGAIELASKPGRGTTVTLYLPRA
jgi:signal transduction histidine kinase